MELEKLEVIIEANMEQVEKQLDALRNKFTGFFDKIDALSSGMGNKVEKNMDISNTVITFHTNRRNNMRNSV